MTIAPQIEILSWDDYFMTMVYLVASKSKDNRTHIGAVIVGPHREIRSTGYNSFVRGLDDSVPERQHKGEKQLWFEHAERNAVYNATLIGASLLDCIMYTNGVPCMDCARGIVQSGIREVVVDKKWETNTQNWAERNRRTLEMFAEVGVKLRDYDTKYVPIIRFNDGVAFPLI
ncbi:MAG: deaminase [Candidatus Pacearchaeota archaeon]|nr:deaminase [Candidatus Pacearchaeota archaeon]